MEISIAIIVLLVFGNLRGVKESSMIFSLPTYVFILALLSLIAAGVYKHLTGELVPALVTTSTTTLDYGAQAVTIFIVLRAFSSGCAAVTGVEAISNAVPNFKSPAPDNAKKAYLLLALAVLVTFGGAAYLAKIFRAVPNVEQTVLAQLSLAIFGKGFMFYAIQAATTVILAMAANTAFAGFPTLLSVIAQDGYVPRQLAMRGHRLNYSNGIVLLAILAALLVIFFEGDTHLLLPLYAVGVFLSFTLSQSGMLVRWLRSRPRGWGYKAFINGSGALVTLLAVIVVGVTKFFAGAWIVIVVIPLLVLGMLKIKRHYSFVAKQLDVPNEMLSELNLNPRYSHHIIVPIASLNAMTIRTLRYAKSLTPNVEAFHVETFEGGAQKLRKKWDLTKNNNVPLIIKQSPFREVVGPLVEYINSEEHASQPGDIITVLLPQFIVPKWWEMALHNNTTVFLANALLHNNRNIVVSVLPFYLEDISFQKDYTV